MSMKRTLYTAISRGMCTAGMLFSLPLMLLMTLGAAHAQAWKPDKPVEIIATNAPGGGADRVIRIMLNVMQERKDFAVPVSINNKPGGGSAVAYAYLNQHPGDGHYVVLGSKALLTNNISGRGPSYTEMTPVAPSSVSPGGSAPESMDQV